MARFRLLAGPVPLHHQVYLDLRAAIEAGEWRPGDRLPPERELAERDGCSLITVRRALTDLARERRLERTRGRGTFVTRPPIPLDLAAPTSFTEEIRRPPPRRPRGRRPFVTRPPIPLDLDAPTSFTEEIRRLGHDPATRVVTARPM